MSQMRTEKTEKTTEIYATIIEKQPKWDISYPKYVFLAKLRMKISKTEKAKKTDKKRAYTFGLRPTVCILY